jgi:TatD DNase family protein
MNIKFADTHAHLDMSKFDVDREDVIKRAVNVGVNTIITVGTDLVSSQKGIEIAANYDGIYAAIGFHPQDASLLEKGDIGKLIELTGHPKVKAIGEIGLDYYRMYSSSEMQLRALGWQLQIASDCHLPIIIHTRNADNQMLTVLRHWLENKDNSKLSSPGVIHCFNGDVKIVSQYLEMGFYIAFGAYVGYPSSRLEDTIRRVPSNKLLVETDCPFLPPQNLRGKRNEPSYIPQIVEKLAIIRGEPLESVASYITENAFRLFNLK